MGGTLLGLMLASSVTMGITVSERSDESVRLQETGIDTCLDVNVRLMKYFWRIQVLFVCPPMSLFCSSGDIHTGLRANFLSYHPKYTIHNCLCNILAMKVDS